MDAQLGQAEMLAERRADAHQLVVAVIVPVVRSLDLAPVGDEALVDCNSCYETRGENGAC